MILGLGLRLFWIFIYPTQLYADSIWYFEKGIEISSGYGYVYDLESMRPTAAWPVGYPAFLAFLFFFTGPSELVAKLANVALSLITIYLTYIYGKWIFNRTIGILSAFLISILPGYIIYSNLVSTDILFAFLTTTTLILAIKPIVYESHKRLNPQFFGIMTGLINGAAVMVRSTGLLLFPLWIFIRWLGRREGRSIILRWGIGLFVGTAGIVLPWTLRNYLVFDEFVPISTNGGWNFWMGNNPHAYGGYIATNNPEINPLLPLIGDEFAVDKTGYELGMEFIRENPLQVIKLIPAKIFYMYNSNDHGLVWNSLSAVDASQRGTGDRVFMLTNLVYTIVGALALIGISNLVLRGNLVRNGRVWVGVIFFIYWTVLHIPYFGLDRFSMPLLPILSTYAASGLCAFLNKRQEQISE
ncbi:MAG: glycosyltransferase family 39 protein [Anaerolineales bacterium]|nr:glycosyltransferase family 39 protein [Anaerolineales bacterium]